MSTNQKIVVFDFETSGLSTTTDDILEIGFIKAVGQDITQFHSLLVNHGRPFSKEIENLTGITNGMV
jgi:DNA polymerase III alpha subunit (gram-positive type)